MHTQMHLYHSVSKPVANLQYKPNNCHEPAGLSFFIIKSFHPQVTFQITSCSQRDLIF